MYKRMLVLLDGSKVAEVVFSYARELSGRLGLDLDFLYVCTAEQEQQLPMLEAYIKSVADKLQEQSAEIQNKLGAKSERRLIKSRVNVVKGYPADEILNYIDKNKIDIMMLATHGRSGIRRWGLGSVADKVIHEAKIPVWLVPSALHEGILYDNIPQRFILVPLDGSKLAEESLPHAINLAKQRGVETKIILVNVSKPIIATLSKGDERVVASEFHALQTANELYLKETAKKLRDDGVEAETEHLIGDPAEEIVRFAADHEPRVIVMTTHGRSGFSRFVFGSVAESVLRRLQKTPLFLIKSSQE